MKPIDPEQSLESAEFLSLDELAVVPGFSERFPNYVSERVDVNGQKVKGIYFKEVGYQRKGMGNEFYKTFPADFVSGDKEVFQKIYNLLSEDHIADLLTRQKEFKLGFLDNYVQGENLIMLSR